MAVMCAILLAHSFPAPHPGGSYNKYGSEGPASEYGDSGSDDGLNPMGFIEGDDCHDDDQATLTEEEVPLFDDDCDNDDDGFGIAFDDAL